MAAAKELIVLLSGFLAVSTPLQMAAINDQPIIQAEDVISHEDSVEIFIDNIDKKTNEETDVDCIHYYIKEDGSTSAVVIKKNREIIDKKEDLEGLSKYIVEELDNLIEEIQFEVTVENELTKIPLRNRIIDQLRKILPKKIENKVKQYKKPKESHYDNGAVPIKKLINIFGWR